MENKRFCKDCDLCRCVGAMPFCFKFGMDVDYTAPVCNEFKPITTIRV